MTTIWKIFAKILTIIGDVPSSIMRWIGGGIDPFHDNATLEGEGFSKQVMGRAESGLQASLGAGKAMQQAKKANKAAGADADRQENHQKLMVEQANLQRETNEALMGKPSSVPKTDLRKAGKE